MMLNQTINRSELSFEWVVAYDNGETLGQYDDAEGKEYNLTDIDLGRVSTFTIISKRNPNRTLSVNLTNGLFYLNGGKLDNIGKEVSNKDKLETSLGNKLRLIYYRRVQRDAQLTEQNIDKLAIIETGMRQMYHFIGWEGKVNGEYYRFEAAMTYQGELYIPPQEKAIVLF